MVMNSSSPSSFSSSTSPSSLPSSLVGFEDVPSDELIVASIGRVQCDAIATLYDRNPHLTLEQVVLLIRTLMILVGEGLPLPAYWVAGPWISLFTEGALWSIEPGGTMVRSPISPLMVVGQREFYRDYREIGNNPVGIKVLLRDAIGVKAPTFRVMDLLEVKPPTFRMV